MSGRCWHPDDAREIGTFKSNVIFENWFRMVLKLIISEDILFVKQFICGTIRENSCRSIALNTLNTIRMFNTVNRTSRFPTGD